MPPVRRWAIQTLAESRRNGQMHVASATLMFVVWLLVASSPRAHGQGMRSSDDGLWRPVSAEAFDVNRLRDVAARRDEPDGEV